MRLTPVTYAGVYIDGTTGGTPYKAVTPYAENQFLFSASPSYTPRTSGYFPDLSGKTMPGTTITLAVSFTTALKGDAFDALKALFDTQDLTLRQLLCKDEDDNNLGWYVNCYPVSVEYRGGRVVWVTLAMKNPIWKTDTKYTSTKAITPGDQTLTVTVDKGNLPALPLITLKPTTASTNGITDFTFVKTYNYTNKTAQRYHILIDTWNTEQVAAAAGKIADNTKYNLINQAGGITATQTTINIDGAVGGGLPTSGIGFMVEADPTKNEQISWTGNSGTQLTGVTRGIGGTGTLSGLTIIGYTHADNTIIYSSHCRADMSDVRVNFSSSSEPSAAPIPRWFSGAGTSSTKIWTTIPYAPNSDIILTSSLAIDATTITITGAANFAYLGGFTGVDGTLLIESEVVTFTSFTTTGAGNDIVGTFSGVTRAKYGTSAAVHAAGVVCHKIPYLSITSGGAVYNNFSEASQPVFTLATSTNSAWVYDNFRFMLDNASSSIIASTCIQWNPYSPDAIKLHVYRADKNTSNSTSANPVEYAGLASTPASSSLTAPETYWQAIFPFGISAVSGIVLTNINRYRVAENPDLTTGVGIKTGASATTWSSTTYIDKNTSTSAWQTLATKTHLPAAGDTYARIFMSKAKTGRTYPSYAQVESLTVNLSTVTTSKIEGAPYVATVAKQTANCSLICSIINTSSSALDAIIINLDKLAVNEELQIDTLNKTVKLKDASGALIPRMDVISWSSVRPEWLPLAQGANALSYSEANVSAVTMTVDWYGRNN